MSDPVLPDATVAAPGFLRRRLITPLLALLSQGATPRRLSLSVALGVAIGLFPIFGTTTLLCAALCLALRLNQPASQLANHLMYPLQIPMILVFVRLGERLAGAPPMPFSPARLAAELEAGLLPFLKRFGVTGLHAVLGWLVVAPMVAAAVYLVLFPILRAMTERRARAAALLLVAGLASLQCTSRERPRVLGAALEIASPAGPSTSSPNLGAGRDGSLLLTWLEAKGSGHTLHLSRRPNGGAWSKARPVAQGNDWFANWADLPSAVDLSDGALAAHWLVRSGADKYAYDVRLAMSLDDGQTWANALTPHRDGVAAEHGFVSLLPEPAGALSVVWLDGRHLKGGAEHGAAGGAAATLLMHTRAGPGGSLQAETILDARVCDCCQTAAARTERGLVVAYRDRSTDEVRDIAVVREEGNGFGEPRVPQPDGWRINGCPVNGPALAARGTRVALAWFTAPSDQGRVYVAFSDDAGVTFGPRLRVDEGQPIGRVDVALLEGTGALVSWIEKTPAGAEVRLRRVEGGEPREALVVSPTSIARNSGFPRLEVQGKEAVVAITDASTGAPRVRTFAIAVPE